MLKNRNKISLAMALGAVVAVISVVMLGNRAGGGGSPLVDPQSVQLSADHVAAQKAAVLAAAGRAAISHIAAAQQGIDASDTALAREHLDVARHLLGQLQEAVGASGSDGAQVVPIFAQVGVRQDVDLTGKLKAQLDALAPAAMKGEHQKVIEGLTATGIAAAYTYVDMPLAGTMAHIEAAVGSLDSGNPDEAGQAMVAANEGLVRETLTVGVSDTSAQEVAAES